MDLLNKLKNLKIKQKEIIDNYEDIVKETEKSLSLIENEKLKKELDELNKEFEQIKNKHKKLNEENKKLKLTLNEQIIDEKMSILKISEKKLDTYFGKSEQFNINNLKKFEYDVKIKINKLKVYVNNNIYKNKMEYAKKLDELNNEISVKIKEERERLLEEEKKLKEEFKDQYKAFADKEVDEATIKKRIKQNRIEMKIGLNWLLRIGVVLIIIAVILFGVYINQFVNNTIRSFVVFLVGPIFIALGEFFYWRKNKNFATGLIGGGIGLLYVAIFLCHFILKTLPMEWALGVSVIVTLTGIVLAVINDSKIIITLGLIGGYLPFTAYIIQEKFSLMDTAIYVSMLYLFIVNLLVIIIAFIKHWRIPNYISFVLNVPALMYLSWNSPNKTVGIIYTSVTFLMYLVLILAYPIMKKIKLKIFDMIVLGLNTFISCLWIYVLFGIQNLDWYKNVEGVPALFFCLIYAGLGLLMSKVAVKEKVSILIFYLTGLTFAVLMVPFQFGLKFITFGWIIESVLFIILGYYIKNKTLEIAGWIIYGLCFGWFVIFDLFYGRLFNSDGGFIFDLKYFVVTLGLVGTFGLYQFNLLKDKFSEFSIRGKFTKFLKFVAIIFTYIFLFSISIKYFRKLINNWTELYLIMDDRIQAFYYMTIIGFVTMGYAFLLSKLKVIYDKVTSVFSVIFYCIGDFLFLLIIFIIPILENQFFNFEGNDVLNYIAFGLLVVYNVIFILSIRDLLIRFVKATKVSIEIYPLIFGIIFGFNILGYITKQLNIENVWVVIGFVFLILAFLYILFGFIKKFLYIRILGLVLTFTSLVLLLFLTIFSFENTVVRIVAFTGFGLIFIVIAFVYNFFNKKYKVLSDSEIKEKTEKDVKIDE